MSDNLMKKQPKNILTVMDNLVSDIGLNDVKTTFDSKTGIASVIGNNPDEREGSARLPGWR